jgi:bloom syndrome protein
VLLLSHFAETFDSASCKRTCDNCASTDDREDIDLKTSATLFVKMMQELGDRHMKITGPLSVQAFRGTSKKDMERRNFNTLKHFGKGCDISAALAKRLLDHLVARHILTAEVEDAQVPDRAPISYIHVIKHHLSFALPQ